MTDNDLTSRLAGLTESDPITALRARRPLVNRHSQAGFEALFEPSNPGDFTPVEREAVALRVSRLHACESLVRLHGDRLASLGVDEAKAAAIASGGLGTLGDERLAAMLAHAELLSREPIQATRKHLEVLAEKGLSTAAIVSLSQLIGFVSFEARLLAGLALLGSTV